MPRNAHAVSTMAVNAGLASRINDFNKHTFYKPTHRSQRGLSASEARLNQGLAEQKRRATTPGERVIPGAAHAPTFRKIPAGGLEIVKGGRAGVGGKAPRRHWAGYKKPSDYAIKKGVKATGMYSIKPRKAS